MQRSNPDTCQARPPGRFYRVSPDSLSNTGLELAKPDRGPNRQEAHNLHRSHSVPCPTCPGTGSRPPAANTPAPLIKKLLRYMSRVPRSTALSSRMSLACCYPLWPSPSLDYPHPSRTHACPFPTDLCMYPFLHAFFGPRIPLQCPGLTQLRNRKQRRRCMPDSPPRSKVANNCRRTPAQKGRRLHQFESSLMLHQLQQFRCTLSHQGHKKTVEVGGDQEGTFLVLKAMFT